MSPEFLREIVSNWPEVHVISSVEESIPRGTEGLLVVGQGRNRPDDSLLLVQNVISDGLSQDQLLFQISANLGKMTAADLMKTTVPKPFDRNAQVSRRDLFAGLRSPNNLVKTYSTAPIIYSSICEAKYGCSKCLDACPTHALTIADGSVTLREQDCSRIGSCTTVCPVSAIQLPRFSESQFLGLIAGIMKMNQATSRTLVLTCDKSTLPQEPWTFIEQVEDIGVIGPRQIAIALSSGIDRVVVYCADGACSGKQAASQAVESIRSLFGRFGGEPETTIVRYLEGDEKEELVRLLSLPTGERAKSLFAARRDAWANYIGALRQIAAPGGLTLGLGLTNLGISDSCTLCQVCANFCPHSALEIISGSLEFDSSKCTGCGYCARVCPEHSITLLQLEKISDLGKRAVFHDEIVKCARCNQPLGSAKYLKNVQARLGKEDPMMKYCNSCKQQIAVEKLFRKSG